MVLARDGTLLREWGGGVLKQPGGIAIGSEPPVVFISDGQRVLRFTTDGQLLWWFPHSNGGSSSSDSISGDGGGSDGGDSAVLVEGRGVAAAADGAVFVTDGKQDLLQKWVPSRGAGHDTPHV